MCALVLLMICLFSGFGHARAEETALNVLLIGVDSAAEGQRGRSDVMMLACIRPESGSVHLVSFLRDLYVSIPGVGKTRLNAAYHHGGEALLAETIEKNFGIAIDRTAAVHFSLLADLVDQLGGIELEIAQRELDHLNDVIQSYNADYGLTGGWIAQAGRQLLDGRQALSYSRIRKIDSDFQRTSRQQAVIAAMLERMSMMSRWDLLKMAVSSLERVETDLTLGDLLTLAPMMGRLNETEILTAQVPFEGTYDEVTINGMMVLSPDLQRCENRLQAFLNEP